MSEKNKFLKNLRIKSFLLVIFGSSKQVVQLGKRLWRKYKIWGEEKEVPCQDWKCSINAVRRRLWKEGARDGIERKREKLENGMCRRKRRREKDGKQWVLNRIIRPMTNDCWRGKGREDYIYIYTHTQHIYTCVHALCSQLLFIWTFWPLLTQKTHQYHGIFGIFLFHGPYSHCFIFC